MDLNGNSKRINMTYMDNTPIVKISKLNNNVAMSNGTEHYLLEYNEEKQKYM